MTSVDYGGVIFWTVDGITIQRVIANEKTK